MNKRTSSSLAPTLYKNEHTRTKRVRKLRPRIRICSTFDETNDGKEQRMSPQEVVAETFGMNGFNAHVKSFQNVGDNLFFKQVEEKDTWLRQRTMDAIRAGDVKTLRELHRAGYSLQCSNKFGESLVHFACRKGNTDVVKLMIHEAEEPLRICDEFGRNPLHEAFWTSEPNFKVVELIARRAPELFLISDGRGHTPLEYAPRSHWSKWIEFIRHHSNLFILKEGCQLVFEPCSDEGEEKSCLEDAMMMLTTW